MITTVLCAMCAADYRQASICSAGRMAQRRIQSRPSIVFTKCRLTPVRTILSRPPSAMLVAFTLHNPDAAGPVERRRFSHTIPTQARAIKRNRKVDAPQFRVDGLSETPAFTAGRCKTWPSWQRMFQLIDEKWRIADEFEQENFFKAHL